MAGHLPFPAAYEPVEEFSRTLRVSPPLNFSQQINYEEELETDFESLSSAASSRRNQSLNLTSARLDLQEVPEVDNDLRELIDAKLADLDSSNASSTDSSFRPLPSKIPRKLLEIVECTIYKCKDHFNGFSLDQFMKQFRSTTAFPEKIDIMTELSRIKMVELKRPYCDNHKLFMVPTKEFIKYFEKKREGMASVPRAIVNSIYYSSMSI